MCCRMGYRTDTPVQMTVPEGVVHFLGRVLSALRRHCAISGIAAIVLGVVLPHLLCKISYQIVCDPLSDLPPYAHGSESISITFNDLPSLLVFRSFSITLTLSRTQEEGIHFGLKRQNQLKHHHRHGKQTLENARGPGSWEYLARGSTWLVVFPRLLTLNSPKNTTSRDPYHLRAGTPLPASLGRGRGKGSRLERMAFLDCGRYFGRGNTTSRGPSQPGPLDSPETSNKTKRPASTDPREG